MIVETADALQPEAHGSCAAEVGKSGLWLQRPPATCSRATIAIVLSGFSLSDPAQAHDIQLNGISRRSMTLTTGESLQVHLLLRQSLCQPSRMAYCMSHNMMETGNPNFPSFSGLSILVKSSGYIADERCAPRGMWPAAPSKPTPQFEHAEPSTDQVPCADLVLSR